MKPAWFAAAFLAAQDASAGQVCLSGWAWGGNGFQPLDGARVWLASGGDTGVVQGDGTWRLEFQTSAVAVSSAMDATRQRGDRIEVVSTSLRWLEWDVFDVRGRRAGSGRMDLSSPTSESSRPLGGSRIRRGWVRLRTESGEHVVSSAPETPTQVLVKDWFEDMVVDSLVVRSAGGVRTSVPLGGWRRGGIGLVQSPGWNPRVRYGSFVDPRDSRWYRTVRIGAAVWMAEDLAIEQPATSWCPPTTDCNATGRVYTWEGARIGCPEGWRLPGRDDWDNLASVLAGTGMASSRMAIALKSSDGWINRGGGKDSLGLRISPAGFRSVDGSWHDRSETASLWTRDTSGTDSAYLVSAEWSRQELAVLRDVRATAYGVRCVAP